MRIVWFISGKGWVLSGKWGSYLRDNKFVSQTIRVSSKDGNIFCCV